ncbi:MAG: SAM-dependent methyltransferase, partial [Halobacteriaceae archaeon]
MKRYHGSYPRNESDYFSESLTYTVAKESGRRFGYLYPESIFGHKGSVFIPYANIWHTLSYTNSRLFTYLMLTQTTERMWEIGQVSKIPWRTELGNIDELENLSKKAVGHIISKRQFDFDSPHYSGPVLLNMLGINDSLPQYNHPHRELQNDVTLKEPVDNIGKSASLKTLGIQAAKYLERIETGLQIYSEDIDETVFDHFNINEGQRKTILQEIALRTNKDPREREEFNPESITEPTDDFPNMVKDLLLHLTLRAVNEDDDGIIPISNVDGEADLLDHI